MNPGPVRLIPTLILAALVFAAVVVGFEYMRAQKIRESELLQPIAPIVNRRKPVKLALDPDAARIPREAKSTTLAKILDLPRPAELDSENAQAFEGARIAPLETTIWRLQATIVEVILREDGDIYLVLQADNRRACAEVPEAAKCKGSRFQKEITQLRASLEKDLKPSAQPKPVGRDAELIGIGFFGPHSGKDNGARLLPLLDLSWRD